MRNEWVQNYTTSEMISIFQLWIILSYVVRKPWNTKWAIRSRKSKNSNIPIAQAYITRITADTVLYTLVSFKELLDRNELLILTVYPCLLSFHDGFCRLFFFFLIYVFWWRLCTFWHYMINILKFCWFQHKIKIFVIFLVMTAILEATRHNLESVPTENPLGPSWFNSFWKEDINMIFNQNNRNLHNRYQSVELIFERKTRSIY